MCFSNSLMPQGQDPMGSIHFLRNILCRCLVELSRLGLLFGFRVSVCELIPGDEGGDEGSCDLLVAP